MKRYIKSAVDLTPLISDFINILSDIYNEKFPHSKCDIWFANCFSSPSVVIRCYLGEDRSDWAYGLVDNDLFNFKLDIDFPDAPESLTADDCVPDNCTMHFFEKEIKLVPKDDWLWCDYHRLKLRTVTGDSQKMIKAWENAVNTLYNDTVMLCREGKLHKQSIQYYDIEEKLSLK